MVHNDVQARDASLTGRCLLVDGDGPGRVRAGVARRPATEGSAGDVLIRAEYSSLNYKDALGVLGGALIFKTLPIVAGIDVAGVVVESSDPSVQVGDQVVVTGFGLGETSDGGYAEWVRVPSEWVVRLPDTLSPWEAMALGTAGLTSALAIHRLQEHGVSAERGPVAVTGAGGGAGSLATGILSALGYEVVAFTGKPGAQHVLAGLPGCTVYGRPDVTSTKSLESAQWAGAVDSVGGDVLGWLLRTTMAGGCVATFGNAGGNTFTSSLFPFILRSVNLLGINTGWFDFSLREDLWRRLGGEWKPSGLDSLTQTIGLDEVVPSLARLLDGEVVGRVVVDLQR